MPRAALFVIDIQHSLAGEPSTRIPHSDRLKSVVTQVLKQARQAKEPPLLVFVQHNEPPESGDLVRGSKSWELVFKPDEVKGDWLVEKDVPSTFKSNPDLTKRLRDQGVEKIVGCGIQSEWCVVSTLTSALEEGFSVVLLKGAHSTYDDGGKTAEEIERNIEKELESKGAKIINWEEWRF